MGVIPNNITLEYMEDNIHDDAWVDYALDHWPQILDRFEGHDLSIACFLIGHTLLHHVDGKELDAFTDRVNDIVIDVSRIGINGLTDLMVQERDGHQLLIDHFDIARLLMNLSVGVLNRGRPIAAMSYLDSAEKYLVRIVGATEYVAEDPHIDACIMYEYCRAKEAEIYLRLIPDVPLKYRPMMSNLAYCYLSHALGNMERYGDSSGPEYYNEYFMHSSELCERYPVLFPYEIYEMNQDSLGDDDYVRWVNGSIMFLNIFNEVPHHNIRYAIDDVHFDLEERYQWLLDDILLTNDHCRRILYRTSKIDPEVMMRKDRDEDVESLLDCYTRLYALLDKVAKLINHLFSLNLEERINFFYVAEELFHHHNPYLRSIYWIKRDIFIDCESTVSRDFDPRNSVHGLAIKTGLIRNSIMHNTLHICKDSESRGVYDGVATITPFELYHATIILYHNVREIILSIQLAMEYRKNE